MAACSLPYNMDNNIQEKITQFWLGEKGVHFSGNMNQGLVHFCWSLKNVLVLFIPNCTRNHVITYTNTRRRQIVVLKCNHLLFAPNNGFTANRKRNNTINWPGVNCQRSLCSELFKWADLQDEQQTNNNKLNESNLKREEGKLFICCLLHFRIIHIILHVASSPCIVRDFITWYGQSLGKSVRSG